MTETAVPQKSAAIRQLGEPIDRLFAFYAAVSGIALAFPGRPAAWPLLAALHIVAIVMGLGLAPAQRAWRAVAARQPVVARLVGDWYPLLLIPLLYTELAALNQSVFQGAYFDDLIIAWEQSIFGGQPSHSFARSAPYLWLSEPLHAAYLSYYLIVFVPPLLLYKRNRRVEFHEAVFTVMLAFFAHYFFFIYFPVQGPRYLFPVPGGVLAQGPTYQLTHALLEAGSSQGSAFPSSHVGASVAQTAATLRFLPGLAPVVALLTAGLGAGAVYGGFHYAIDVASGFALGTACALAAPWLYRRLRRTARLDDDGARSFSG